MDAIRVQPSADGLLAAYTGAGVVAVREWRISSTQASPTDGLLDFSVSRVVESGSLGAPGELWWGRISGGPVRMGTVGQYGNRAIPLDALYATSEGQSVFVAVGQETRIRRFWSVMTPEDQQEYRAGRLGPWPVGARALRFEQRASTAVVSRTTSPVLPGTVSKAVLDLSIAENLSGTLTFDLSISGETGSVTLPVKRDVDESRAARLPDFLPDSPYRLREGRRPSLGAIVDCRIGPNARTLGDRCYFDDQEARLTDHWPQEPQYRVSGMFFGPTGEYLAIVFLAMPPLPSDPKRIWGDLQGLVILQRTIWK